MRLKLQMVLEITLVIDSVMCLNTVNAHSAESLKYSR